MASDILIVDDEADIRELVAGILQDEGYDDAHRARQRRGARRDRDAPAEPGVPRHLAAGQRARRAAAARQRQGAASRTAGGDDLRPRQHRDRGRRRSSAAPTTSSRSRSRPTGWCWSPSARWRTRGSSARSRSCKQLAPAADGLVGTSPAINQLRQMIEKVAPTNSRILIVGPSGAGKELAARTIHRHSARADGPFVVINAAAITPERMEIELFGVEAVERRARAQGRRARRGAWRHAVHRRDRRHAARDAEQDPARAGRSDLPARRRQQQGRRSTCASSPRPRATSKPRSPPASSARTSITASRWCRSACRRWPSGARTSRCWSTISWTRFRRRPACRSARIGEDAMAVLQSHDWPGNVRQLRNNVERLMILAGGDADAVINAEHAAAGRRRDGAEHAERQWRRASDGPAAARGARGVRARISGARRSAASAATSRAPPNSSAWSARRCTASSRRSASGSCPSGRRSRTLDVAHRLCERPLSCRTRARRGAHRGPRLSVRRRRLRGLRGAGRAAGRRAPPHGPAGALARRTADRDADAARRARRRAARDRPPQPRARRHRLSAGHARRRAARPRLSAAGTPPSSSSPPSSSTSTRAKQGAPRASR